jgi:hypothetical protein
MTALASLSPRTPFGIFDKASLAFVCGTFLQKFQERAILKDTLFRKP